MYFSNFIVRFKDMRFQWLSALRYLSAVNFAYSAYLKVRGARAGRAAALKCASARAARHAPGAARTRPQSLSRSLLRARAWGSRRRHCGE